MHRDIAVRDLRTGAVVAAIVAVRAEHFAVAIERDLQNHFLLARLIGGYEIFIAIFDPLQRPAKAERGEDDRDLFLPWMVLEAETSADVLGDHADRGLRQPKRQRGPARHHMWALTGDVERQLFGAVAHRDDTARLHRRLRDALVHDFLRDE